MSKTRFQEFERRHFGQRFAPISQPFNEPYERSAHVSQRQAYRHGRQSQGDWSRRVLEDEREERLARGLGWFSVGLGIMQIAAPRTFARMVGLNGNQALMRMIGIREIASGLGILSNRKPTGWLWSRVGGDLMDLAILGHALVFHNANCRRVAIATAAVTGMTVLDLRVSKELSSSLVSEQSEDKRIALQVRKSITINCSPEELYGFWHDLENLPLFMEHLESAQVTGEKRSRWVAKGPAGKAIKWDAETVDDRPNELIAWRSIEGSDVENSGSVRFAHAPAGRGTTVRVEFQYRPPAGLVGATIAKLLGEDPELQLEEDLHRFKQLMEIGEILTTEGQPAGRARSTSWKYDRAARRIAAAA